MDVEKLLKNINKIKIFPFSVGFLIGVYPAHDSLFEYLDSVHKVALVGIAIFTSLWTHKRFAFDQYVFEAREIVKSLDLFMDKLDKYILDLEIFGQDINFNEEVRRSFMEKKEEIYSEYKIVSDRLLQVIHIDLKKHIRPSLEKILETKFGLWSFDVSLVEKNKEFSSKDYLVALKDFRQKFQSLREEVLSFQINRYS